MCSLVAFAQEEGDSTVTYTFNDTTITFNLAEIRQALEQTDMTEDEIEMNLNFDLFWKSLFPPPKPHNRVSSGSNTSCEECLNLNGFIVDPANGEIQSGGDCWSHQYDCTAIPNPNYNPNLPDNTVTNPKFLAQDYGDLNYNMTDPSWTDYTCNHPGPGEASIIVNSDSPYTIMQSTPGSYDPHVLRVLINPSSEVIELNAPSGNSQFLRIGDQVGGYHAHRIVGRFTVPTGKPFFKYNYAVALHDTDQLPEHGSGNLDNTGKPYFTVRFRGDIDDDGIMDEIPCADYSVIGTDSENSNLETHLDGIRLYNVGAIGQYSQPGMIVNWTPNVANFSNFNLEGKEVEVEFTLVECNQGGHSGWAYIDLVGCEEGGINLSAGGDCAYSFSTETFGNYGLDNESYCWQFGDEIPGDPPCSSTEPNPSHTYSAPGTYTVTLNIEYENFFFGNNFGQSEVCDYELIYTLNVCCDCESSFAPIPGRDYVLSAWVQEDHPDGITPKPTTYDVASVVIDFYNQSNQFSSTTTFKAKGAIIDGWQRIEEEFSVPANTGSIRVRLENSSTAAESIDVYFDDIRMHPFDASMKSFVYDPLTLRLSAELDERNYATYYEYDEEGALIRVKKETERGIMTIQEGRNAIRKNN